jgi:rod shape determining protein RodA
VAAAIFFIQKKLIFDSVYILYGIGFALLLVPYFLRSSVAGTARWIPVGSMGLQPSEFMKILVMLAIARFVASTSYSNLDFKFVLIPALFSILRDCGAKATGFGDFDDLLRIVVSYVILGGRAALSSLYYYRAGRQRDKRFQFLYFFVWVVVILIVLYFTKEKLWISLTVMLSNLALGFATPVLWGSLKPYQQQRIMTLFNIEADPQGAGYQVIQSKIAIGSGGLFGKGIAHGTQTHLKFLPEQHTDFIFSVIGEEYGFIGAVVVLVLFLAFILLCLYIAYRQKDSLLFVMYGRSRRYYRNSCDD